MKRKPILNLTKKNWCGLFILSTLLGACTNNQKNLSEAKEVEKEKPLSITCYRAIASKDTAYLTLETHSKGQVRGELKFTYRKKPKNEGNVEGKFVGDTLFVDYTFNVGDHKMANYKNPLAFLKSGDRLTLGVGEIRTYLGHSYLDKKVKIDFEKGKFIFTTVPCK